MAFNILSLKYSSISFVLIILFCPLSSFSSPDSSFSFYFSSSDYYYFLPFLPPFYWGFFLPPFFFSFCGFSSSYSITPWSSYSDYSFFFPTFLPAVWAGWSYYFFCYFIHFNPRQMHFWSFLSFTFEWLFLLIEFSNELSS